MGKGDASSPTREGDAPVARGQRTSGICAKAPGDAGVAATFKRRGVAATFPPKESFRPDDARELSFGEDSATIASWCGVFSKPWLPSA